MPETPSPSTPPEIKPPYYLKLVTEEGRPEYTLELLDGPGFTGGLQSAQDAAMNCDIDQMAIELDYGTHDYNCSCAPEDRELYGFCLVDGDPDNYPGLLARWASELGAAGYSTGKAHKLDKGVSTEVELPATFTKSLGALSMSEQVMSHNAANARRLLDMFDQEGGKAAGPEADPEPEID